MTNTLTAVAASLLSVTFSPEIRTAYLSRGKIVEDRPIQANGLRLEAKLGEDQRFGRVGFWHFDYSSLTPRVNRAGERFMHEFDWGATYHYDFQIADEWQLSNEVMPCWILVPHSSPTMEWWVNQSLKNPYLVPTWLMRRGTDGAKFAYFKVGVKKPISLQEANWSLIRPLTLTPGIYSELGNSSLMTLRYGKVDNGESISTGIQSFLAEIRADYKLTEHVSLYASLLQFDLINKKARRQSHKPNSRDLTILTMGIRMSF